MPDLNYELVVSSRAKRASLRVLPGRGLVVTVPQRVSKKAITALVDKHRGWIDEKLAELQAATLPCYRQWPPVSLPLRCIGSDLNLRFATRRNWEKYDDEHDVQLTIRAAADDKAAVAAEVATHLKALARRVLPPILASHAQLHALHYKRVSIRGQRTVWGSYSNSGTLSLNYKLLFLERELVDYVLLHELAHTVHLDHSEKFWRLLCSMNVNARVLDRKLAKAAPSVPPWLC